MPCGALIKAADGDPASRTHKGDVVVVRDLPWTWGAKEGLPSFVQLTVPDASAAQVSQYLDAWPLEFFFSIVNENAAGWRLTAAVAPGSINLSGVGRQQMKAAMQEWAVAPYDDDRGAGGSVVSFTSESMTIDVPKTGLGSGPDALKLIDLKRRFDDRFRAELGPRYYFSSADVDSAVAAGGAVTMNRAELLLRVADRLAE